MTHALLGLLLGLPLLLAGTGALLWATEAPPGPNPETHQLATTAARLALALDAQAPLADLLPQSYEEGRHWLGLAPGTHVHLRLDPWPAAATPAPALPTVDCDRLSLAASSACYIDAARDALADPPAAPAPPTLPDLLSPPVPATWGAPVPDDRSVGSWARILLVDGDPYRVLLLVWEA